MSGGTLGWVTNDPVAAAKLRALDDAYDAARRAAEGMLLRDKIVALRRAKDAHRAGYDAIFAGSR